MVLTSCPSAITTSVVQDFTALPSRWTTQAPHCEESQPTCVPVRRRFSRKNCTSSVRGSTLALTGLPFTIRDILAISTLFICARTTATQSFQIIQGHNMGHPGNEQPREPCVLARSTCDQAIQFLLPEKAGLLRRKCSSRSRLALYGLGEVGEKLIGQFLGRAVDEPLPELGQLAADLRLDIVFEQGPAVLL